jgi:Tfp pilus assembly protein PilN
MPEINLLGQKQAGPFRTNALLRVAIWILGLLVVGEIVIGASLFFLKQRAEAKLARVEEKKQTVSGRFGEYEDRRKKAVALQSRLLLLPRFLEQRKSVRAMLDEIASVTPRDARYTNLRWDDKGKLFVSGVVRSYRDLGELLLALRTSPHVDSAILRNVGPSTKEIAGVQFDIDLLIKPTILQQP